MKHVVIVGSGASAATLVIRLAALGVKITVIDREGVGFRGWAYSATAEYHLLNIPSGAMTCDPDKPSDLDDYLAERVAAGTLDPKWLTPEHRHVPRRVFGDYLNDRVEKALAAGSSTLDKIAGNVVGMDKSTVTVKLNSSADDTTKRLEFDFAVLAIGNLKPEVLRPLQPLSEHPNFVQNPWKFPPIPKDATICLVGTRLTAVDFTLHLTDAGFSGNGFFVSRSGKLPHENIGERLSDPHSLDFLGTDPAALTVDEIASCMREECRSNASSFHEVVDCVRPLHNDWWRQLSLEQRTTFLEKHRDDWEVKRHRVAPGQLKPLEALLSSGRFENIAQGIKSTQISPEGSDHPLQLTLADGRTLAVDYVINCTGPNADYRNTKDSLISELRESGLLFPDPSGIAAHCEPGTGRLINREGAPNPNIFLCGPPRKGSEWECIAIKNIREHAKEVSGTIEEMLA